jgi:hypothetical protein
MHATMIMLVDLYEKPTSLEAPRSRALIDEVLRISGPDGGIVSGEDGVSVQRPLREGGREAWSLLRKLREKAWQKAGLDPNVHWTEESQIQAGIAQPLTDAQRMAQSFREDVLHDPLHSRNSETSAGVRDLLSSAVKDMHNANTEPLANQKLTTRAATLKSTNQWQHTTTAPPIETSSSENFIPSSTSAPPNLPNGYHTSTPAPSVIASTNNPSTTRTTPPSQMNTTANLTPIDTLPPDTDSTTPFDNPTPPPVATCPPPPPDVEEEHNIDEDFWTRWDSIFGSRAELSFEDVLMDDINWDDLGGHDENMT